MRGKSPNSTAKKSSLHSPDESAEDYNSQELITCRNLAQKSAIEMATNVYGRSSIASATALDRWASDEVRDSDGINYGTEDWRGVSDATLRAKRCPLVTFTAAPRRPPRILEKRRNKYAATRDSSPDECIAAFRAETVGHIVHRLTFISGCRTVFCAWHGFVPIRAAVSSPFSEKYRVRGPVPHCLRLASLPALDCGDFGDRPYAANSLPPVVADAELYEKQNSLETWVAGGRTTSGERKYEEVATHDHYGTQSRANPVRVRKHTGNKSWIRACLGGDSAETGGIPLECMDGGRDE
ncbi:hypothetical protein C8R45DRAFT_938515 [Mycena sanguinolenta]|nr:hypothetical protein C8R45DRAFT_938515 [Mycena sanguinolenta]